MKTYDERMKGVEEKIKKKKTKQKILRAGLITAGSCLTVLAMALLLFLPYDRRPPDVTMYANSPYYDLIQSINEATYTPPRYKNNYELLKDTLASIGGIKNVAGSDMAPGDAENAPAVDDGLAMEGATGSYVEVTDNQVMGVIEADIVKRSDKHIYHLLDGCLRIYSIEGEASRELGSVNLLDNEDYYFTAAHSAQMFLSQDCTAVSIITSVALRESKEGCIAVLNYDVSEPDNIREAGTVFITGSFKSARMVDGQIMLLSNYYIPYDKDFGDESTYLPQIGTLGNMQSIAAENICFPDELSSTTYTVVTLLDGKTLELTDSAAFLSFANEVYVSENHIFATRAYTESEGENRVQWSEISCLSYENGDLQHKGSVSILGDVKNQYSMDEHEGILRVVTSTQEWVQGEQEIFWINGAKRNASLYCIDLERFQVVASVEGFAPEGENAQSVRFDGDYAYVCTAEVITLTDPVYFFDLSDLSNITYKDTGTIDGYSTSLVNFGEGYLLGIGYGDELQLKIEVYIETPTGVESLCSYEAFANFSEDYKSYFIDRENRYIGIGYVGWEDNAVAYLLLQFDGYNLNKVTHAEMETRHVEFVRAFAVDGYLYILENKLQVVKLP